MDYPILFLDIDGVLNSEGWFWRQPRLTIADHPRGEFDPAAVTLVNGVLKEANAKVVISSAWRCLYTMEKLLQILTEAQFTGEVIDRTPYLSGEPRGIEIQTWLDAQEAPPKRFAIVDDEEEMCHLTPHLIRTEWRYGFQQQHVDPLLKLLMTDYLP